MGKMQKGTGLSKSGREKSWDLNQRQSGRSYTKGENDSEVSKMEDLPGKVENFQLQKDFFPTENLCRPITFYKIFLSGNGL